jgi:hypothetical protein
MTFNIERIDHVFLDALEEVVLSPEFIDRVLDATFAQDVNVSVLFGAFCGPLRLASAPADVRTGSLRAGWRSDCCDPFYGREYATLPPTMV